MRQNFYAHIRMNDGEPTYQMLRAHCDNTAKYASDVLAVVGLSATGRLAGLLHDVGKARKEFQKYLYDAVVAEKTVKRGSVNHTSAGCRYFLESYHSSGELDIAAITSELLAYSCGGHHGLFDCLEEKNGFQHRLSDEKIEYEDVKKNYLSNFTQENDSLFTQAVQEIEALVGRIVAMCEDRAQDEPEYYMGMLSRLLLSAVMEGDRRDTAEFMRGKLYPEFYAGASREEMWRRTIEYMEQKLDAMDKTSSINKARREISDQCAAFAEKPGGIIRLNVPTGAGKTLASLRYALRHAAEYGKSRIIFTSSLLSVLDQNAKVIRDYLPEQDMILEHHSNVVQPEQAEEREEWEMMVEAWRSPVIITTLVQLLNTLFLGRTSNIRRFHALCNAVLVIDEVQTVPNNLLTLFNLTMNFLSEVCGTTIVLCSATQPFFEGADHPLLVKPADMVPYDESIWQVFRRTNLRVMEPCRLEELPEKAEVILQEKQSLLIVCNMKKEAQTLFGLCSDIDAAVFHLSAGMCMQHRRDTLTKMQEALNRKEKVLCISTQVIEAGVDISFGCVIRLQAGMDSIVQSAGRCNRNGESEVPADVYILDCVGEKLGRLHEIKAGQEATGTLLQEFRIDPARFQNDLTSDEAIERYFKKLYAQMDPHFQDGVVPQLGTTLYNLLSVNKVGGGKDNSLRERYFMHQAFKTAGENFEVFDTDTVEAIVGYGEGRVLRSSLIEESESFIPNYEKIHILIQQARPYTVSLYRYQREMLEKRGALRPLFDGRVTVLLDGFYNEHTGFTTDEILMEV